ncbi:MAG: YdaU family protein [Rhodocyclaceae bacterium]|nr:YdaU family protein [Rhodocyclaceae bacterium]
MHYYKRNLGDYAKKAGRLSIVQHGVYTLLLDACYDRERFPTREEAIEWTWAGSQAEIEAVDFVLSRFFVLEEGRFVQLRVREELAEYHAKAVKNAEIAKAREEKKRSKTVTENERNDHELAENKHEPSTNRSPDVRKSEPNHKPITNNHKPVDKTHTVDSSTKGATPAGLVCSALMSAGIQRVNPAHAELIALIAAGATIDEFKHAAAEAVERKKPSFAYALGIVRGQRRQALEAASLTVKPSPARGKHADRQRTAEAFARRSQPDAIEGTFTRTD